jgi:hypothetical protein
VARASLFFVVRQAAHRGWGVFSVGPVGEREAYADGIAVQCGASCRGGWRAASGALLPCFPGRTQLCGGGGGGGAVGGGAAVVTVVVRA